MWPGSILLGGLGILVVDDNAVKQGKQYRRE